MTRGCPDDPRPFIRERFEAPRAGVRGRKSGGKFAAEFAITGGTSSLVAILSLTTIGWLLACRNPAGMNLPVENPGGFVMRATSFSVLIILVALSAARAEAPSNDLQTEESWTRAQVMAGEPADLRVFCSRSTPQRSVDNTAKECGTISAQSIVEMLTRKSILDQVPPQGLHLIGAHIRGDLDLSDLRIDRPLLIGRSTLSGDVVLRDTEFTSTFALENSVIDGNFTGDGLRAHDLFLGGTHFAARATLIGATIDGRLSTNPAIGVPESKNDLSRTTFKAGLDARYITFKVGFLEFTDAAGDFNLKLAKIAGDLDMMMSNLTNLTLYGAHVGGSFNARSANISGIVAMSQAAVEGAVDLRGARLAIFQLVGSNIKEDLILASPSLDLMSVDWQSYSDSSTCRSSMLELRNAHVGAVQADMDAWPGELSLEGFTYDHLTGFSGQTRDEQSTPLTWWHGWLQRDHDFSPQPYTELAAYFTMSGNRDAAATIAFYGKQRERIEAGLRHEWGQWMLLAGLEIFAGYGIGDYAFRALGWVLILTLIGVLVLQAGSARNLKAGYHVPPPRWLWVAWSFGASLQRILPIVELSADFKEGISELEKKHFGPWQFLIFTLLSAAGWLLGLFVLAAFSGLAAKT